MNLAPGDHAIITALFEYRCLSASQLARALGRSNQVIRRRVRRVLVPAGLVGALDRGPTEEAAYFLGPEGFKYMAEEWGCTPTYLPMPREISSKRGLFWRHTMLVNDVRLAFVAAMCQPSSPLELLRTVPECELVPGAATNAPHHERFVLSERFQEGGRTHFHRPDCLFLVYPRAVGRDRVVACFVEADRNTESLRRIREKLWAYKAYWKRRKFADFGAIAMRVLFVVAEVTTNTRIDSMREEVRAASSPDEALFRDTFRFVRADGLRAGVLAKPIWFDVRSDEPRYFFQPVVKSTETVNRAAGS